MAFGTECGGSTRGEACDGWAADMNRDRSTLVEIRSAYDRRAAWFDAFVRGASLGRDPVYREAAVRALRLAPGRRVLDLGCGTGLNLSWVAPPVGPAGLVIGVDLSLPMLLAARAKAQAAGWSNVRLVQSEGSRLRLAPASVDAVLSTYTLTTVPDWPAALHALLAALRPGGRIAILDDRLPPGWFVGPAFMLRSMWRGGWRDQAGGIVRALERACGDIAVANLHGGLIYLIVGVKR